jgi:holo-[acyl-carrier protein] synthase
VLAGRRRACEGKPVILGVGIDVVDVDRFARTLGRSPRLRERLFTDAEQQLPPASLAARFAAKEALAKALGAPVGLHWRDAGRPHLTMRGTVERRATELGVRRTHISLSHDAGIASAVVLVED